MRLWNVMGVATIREHWPLLDDKERRRILLDHLDTLRIRRGVVGRYFDKSRVLIRWKAMNPDELEAAS